MLEKCGYRVWGVVISFSFFVSVCSAGPVYPVFSEIPIIIGATSSGNISSSNLSRKYSFNAVSGDTIGIIVYKDSGNFYPCARVSDPAGKNVLSVTNGYSTFRAGSTGRFTVDVSDYYGSYYGSYYLTVQRMNSPGNYTGLMPGENRVGVISAAGINSYKFSCSSAGTLLINLSRVSGNVYLDVYIYDSSGNKVTSRNLNGGGTVSLNLPSAGTYYAYVKDYYLHYTGSYGINFQFSGSENIQQVSFGSTLTVNVSNNNPAVYCVFNATAGDTIGILPAHASINFHPYIQVFDSRGNRVASASNSLLTFKLTSGGKFILSLSDYYSVYSGSCQLTFQRLNAPAGAVCLSSGRTVSGCVDTAGFVSYSYNASAAGSLTVALKRLSGSVYLELLIYDPAGNKIAGKNLGSGGSFVFNIPAAGVYYLYLKDYYSFYSGTYELSVSGPGNNSSVTRTPVALGTAVEGMLSAGAYSQEYSLNSSNTDFIFLMFNRLDSGFYPRFEAFDDSGNSLASLIMSAGGYVLLKPAVNTAVSLRVSSAGANSTGGYVFTAQRLNNASLLAPGEARGALSSSSAVSLFSLSGVSAGNRVAAGVRSLSGSAFTPAFIIFDESGCQQAYSDGMQLSDKKYYLCLYSRMFNSSGSYVLTLARPLPDASRISLSLQAGSKVPLSGDLNVTAKAEEWDSRFGTAEFQFLIDGAVKRDFSSLSSFSLPFSDISFGKRLITVRARNANGVAEKTSEVCLFRNPPQP